MNTSSGSTPRGSVVVTGASSGIGEACARRLAAEGFHVFAGVRRPSDAARLERLASDTTRITPLTIDVTDAASITQAARAVDDAVGGQGLAGVVNNAGIAVAGPLEYLPIEELRRQMEVNLVGTVAVTQAFLPAVRSARGRLVFIGSIGGRLASAFLGPYAASKFAVRAIGDAWRAELAPWGLHVSLVEPGSIATPIWEKGIAEGDALITRLPDQGHRRYGAAIQALRRVAAHAGRAGAPPTTVADAVLHALTAGRPKTKYVVGGDARMRAWIARLPDRWRDALIAHAMRLPRTSDEP
jgi:NAD(P)-dependent dehydrogenase (short-subunit alcohol dehydrogenase family)